MVDWKLTLSHAVLDTRLSTLLKSTTETFSVTSHCLSTRTQTSCRLWARSAKVGNKGHPRDGAYSKLAFRSTTLAKKMLYATRGICASRAHVADRSQCRMLSHDRTADQSHEYLGCDDFFGQGSTYCQRNQWEHASLKVRTSIIIIFRKKKHSWKFRQKEPHARMRVFLS